MVVKYCLRNAGPRAHLYCPWLSVRESYWRRKLSPEQWRRIVPRCW